MTPDDDIEASKAPLMEHLLELRRRLMWSLLAVFLAFLVCFWFAKPIYNLLLWPYRLAVGSDVPIEMIYTAPQEFFFTQVKLAIFGAIFIAFPVIASQIYMFVAPGLYRNERQAFLPYLIATPILFLLGAALVYFVAMPLAMKFFLSMQQTGDTQVQIHLTARVSEYLSLIMALILGFGICFQLPVLLTLLARAGIVTADGLKRYRRHAILGVFIVAAVLTPPDPISQISLAIPTILLYELSIYAVKLVEKKRAAAQCRAQARRQAGIRATRAAPARHQNAVADRAGLGSRRLSDRAGTVGAPLPPSSILRAGRAHHPDRRRPPGRPDQYRPGRQRGGCRARHEGRRLVSRRPDHARKQRAHRRGHRASPPRRRCAGQQSLFVWPQAGPGLRAAHAGGPGQAAPCPLLAVGPAL